MLSPFPGMDPYLEHPAGWPDIHQGLMSSMRAILNASLPQGYVARMDERCQIIQTGRNIYPDVLVRSPTAVYNVSLAKEMRTIPDPPTIVEVQDEEPAEIFLEIHSMRNMKRVITVIEILSPSNKSPVGKDRDSYLQKQKELLHSEIHFLEIDLLRAGFPAVSAYAENYGALDSDYIVCLHRARQLKRYETWPIKLTDGLPCVAVPLDEGVPDAALDLQAVFDRNYEEGAYAGQIDYASEAFPPLSDAQAKWADSLLREKKLR